MDFKVWKRLSPVQQIAEQLGFNKTLAECTNWDDYTTRFIAANDREGRMVHAAKELFEVLSTGERPVLAAMSHAADFSRIADQLSGTETWSRLDRTYGDHAVAVGLAIMRR